MSSKRAKRRRKPQRMTSPYRETKTGPVRPGPLFIEPTPEAERQTERVSCRIEAAEVAVDGVTVVVPDGHRLGKPFVTLRAGSVCNRLTGDSIAIITTEMLAEIKRVFDSRREQDPVIIDWNHNSSPQSPASPPEDSGALGEIVELRLTEDGLALVAIPSYTTRGLSIVEAAEGSLWSSPEFIHGDVHARESGEPTGSAQLLAITLTPRPQQTASSVDRVTLTEETPEETYLMETREEILALEKDQLADVIEQQKQRIEELELKLKGENTDGADESDEVDTIDEEDEVAAPADDPPPVKTNATDDDEEDKMSIAMSEGGPLLLAEVQHLREQVTALQQINREQARDADVNALIRSGRVTPAERELALNAWDMREERPIFWAGLSERKVAAVTLGEIGHGASTKRITETDLVERVKLVASEKGIEFKDALAHVRSTEKEYFLTAINATGDIS